MSQAGARGPAPPPKPPPVPAKHASPPAPPVAPKGVVAPKVPAAIPPGRAGKATMLGVQAPKVAPAAPPAPAPPDADDSWDVAPTRIEERNQTTSPGVAPAPTPQAPPPAPAAVTPVAPPVTLAATPLAAHVAHPPASSSLTSADVRLIVRTLVEDALLPLQRALVEAQQRIAELERRPASVASTVVLSATPAPAFAGQSAYASAMAAPVRTAALHPATMGTVPPPPLLDVAAIERDVPLDVNNPFDGARRRRRMAVFVVVAMLAIFGGLFALLAESYTPHP